jgi:hypothetical protein
MHRRVRRWWRSQLRHSPFRHWLIYRGSLLAAGYAGLYVTNGFVIGWRETYDVNVAITSPAATSAPLLAWPLSVAGWLMVPVLAGALAGYMINTTISGRRSKSIKDIFTKDRSV